MKKICFIQKDKDYLDIVISNESKTKYYHYYANLINKRIVNLSGASHGVLGQPLSCGKSTCDYEKLNIKWHTNNKNLVVGEVVGYGDFKFPKWFRRKLKITAKCHPEDTFDFNVGRKIVKERMGFDPDAGDEVDFNPDVPDKETTILLLKHFFLANELHSTWKQKNKAYGNSFGKSVEKYGLTSALTRMSDKWNRIENLIMKADVNVGDEPLRDSLMDLANYCLMTVMCIDEEKDKESAS